ncbi:Mediator of RNA polymerase II transcription subunit 8 [Aphelenchoides besseyi]|nr:Mediator of RNA polymerase II transcription subunit 8 [Aphelenchoides besseyi]
MERQRMLPTTDQQTADPGVLACINHLEQRLCEIKSTIRDLLVLLEQQERVNYPELLHNLFLLAESFSNIQEKIKKVLAPGGGAFDENWTSLQTHLLVPNAVDMNESTQLLKETENRLTSWNHEVVPDYLRTQLAPRVLEQERSMEKEGQLSGSGEQLSKKVSTFNKNVDTITGDPFRLTVPPTAVDAQSSAILQEELQRFVRAIMKGEGVRPKTGTLKK